MPCMSTAEAHAREGQALGGVDEGGWTNNKMGRGQKLLRAD